MTTVPARHKTAMVAAAILAGGCAFVAPVIRQTDGWTIALLDIRDGIGFMQSMSYTAYSAPPGYRFLHFNFKFKNDATVPRQFGYDSCDIDLGTERIVPSVVTASAGIATVINGDEIYSPGESSHRFLTFSYPKGRAPTRVQCAGAVFVLAERKR